MKGWRLVIRRESHEAKVVDDPVYVPRVVRVSTWGIPLLVWLWVCSLPSRIGLSIS